jgi:hypothetical protein
VLKHPQFAHLRADGNNYQACLCDEESYKLIFQMYDDVIQATRGVDYFFVSTDEIYYTLGGDSRVFRRVLSSGEISIVHDFGSAGIARDVHVAGGRLTAIVGGRVAFSGDPGLGPTQWDSAGIVHVVDLSSGADVALDGPGLFRRPALAPAGDRLVAEGYPLIIQDVFDPNTQIHHADTTVGRAGDLYLFVVP